MMPEALLSFTMRVVLSPRPVRLVKCILFSVNPYWLLLMNFMPFVCLGTASTRTCSTVFLRLEVRLTTPYFLDLRFWLFCRWVWYLSFSSHLVLLQPFKDEWVAFPMTPANSSHLWMHLIRSFLFMTGNSIASNFFSNNKRFCLKRSWICMDGQKLHFNKILRRMETK